MIHISENTPDKAGIKLSNYKLLKVHEPEDTKLEKDQEDFHDEIQTVVNRKGDFNASLGKGVTPVKNRNLLKLLVTRTVNK